MRPTTRTSEDRTSQELREAFRARKGWRFTAETERHGHGRGRRRGGQRFGPGFGGRGGGYPGGGFGFGGPFFGRGPKVGRGDVRIAILALLAEEPMHGYQVIQELSKRSGGVWRPSPGSIYPTLQQLEDEGLVQATESEGRRVFHLTDAGRAEVDKRGPEGGVPWDSFGDGAGDSLLELRNLAFGVAGAVMQVAQTGTDGQIERAKEILNESRRRLYGILAEEEPETSDGGG